MTIAIGLPGPSALLALVLRDDLNITCAAICSENYFRYAHGMVFQIQLARRIEDVPQTRDYINRDEEKYLKLL